ncbi:hypothetical protein WR25_03294 isoform B [Diploscapter pachys]|uniref:Protein asunder n=1 Tax=Diploscapter pachys TaxID=2018661 RepID=A0A2A2JQG6_9BILA|nr:hypothetical protein WR25_03294 isoform B [Diploscapter pachys]
MLEVKPKENMPVLEPNVGQKLISHTLIAHEGRIHIHSIYLGKINTFDNKTLRNKYLIPVDKRVRAHEFRVLMKECALFLDIGDSESEQANGKEMKVVKSRGVNELEQEPCESAISQANNLLRYWPIHKDSTLIRFEGSKYESMFNLLRQAELSTVDVDKCKQGISQISALRDSKDSLYPPDILCTKLKQPSTREDQYSVLIREIRDHMLNYVEHSDRHFEVTRRFLYTNPLCLQVFNLFVQVMGLERSTNIVLNDPQASSKPNMDVKIGKKFAHMNKKADPRLARERRGSPPLKRAAKGNDWKPGEKINLYSMLCEQENKKGRDKWMEFAGRVNATSSQAILYPNLNADQSAHNSHISHSNEQRPSSRMET